MPSFIIWHITTRGLVDLTSIESFDYHISACNIAIGAFNARFFYEVSGLKRERNEIVAIHSNMTNNILADILFLALDQDRWRESLQDIASVCQLWRKTIQINPRFWTWIDASYPLPVVDTYLLRSGASPLTIELDDTLGYTFQEDEFVTLVSQQAHRWKSVRFRGTNVAALRTSLQKRTLFMAHIMDVEPSCRLQELQEPWDIPLSPTIRHLSLRNLNWHIASSITMRLVYLSLLDVQVPSLLDVVRIISTSPDLRVLVLRGITASSHTPLPELIEDRPPCEYPIDLPKLEAIHLSRLPPNAGLAHHLLERIHSITTYHVWVDDMPLSIFKPYSTVLRTICRAVVKASCVEVSMNEVGRWVGVSTALTERERQELESNLEDPGLFFCRNAGNLSNEFPNIIAALRSLGFATPLRLTINAHKRSKPGQTDPSLPFYPPFVISPSAIAPMLEVGSLTFRGDVDIQPILRALSRPPTEGGGLWPGHILRVMDFGEWEGSVDILLGFFRQRWGDGETAPNSFPIERPPKLERLVLPQATSKDVRLVQRVAVCHEVRIGSGA